MLQLLRDAKVEMTLAFIATLQQFMKGNIFAQGATTSQS
jgi:hypothetical protein